MNNFLFETIKRKRLKRNKFNLSHDVKLSMRMGELIPIFCQDVLPGDTFKLNTEMLVRFAPLIAPVMHRVNVYTHYFFVPKRLLWSAWKDFITGGEDGTAAPPYPRLVMKQQDTAKDFVTGSLADFLNFPVQDAGTVGGVDVGDNRQFTSVQGGYYTIDELPFRAYQLIWNEYYRDQNLQDEIPIGKEKSGLHTIYRGSVETTPDDSVHERLLQLRGRAWTKDYFTSALPFAQRGEPVTLPLGGTAEISANQPQTLLGAAEEGGVGPATMFQGNGASPAAGNLKVGNGNVLQDSQGHNLNLNSSNFIDNAELAKNLNVDISKVTSATIVELRNAFKAQEFLEAQARGGSRYIEFMNNIFGVRSSDARLQRPEYLGGGKQPLVISDVLQTSQSTDSSPLATPSGSAASLGRSHSFKRYFEEYGYVIGVMSILPEPCYQQGMPRMYMKFDRYDHYLPQFARIGEQEIDERELYFSPGEQGDPDYQTNPLLFGYQSRYSEYKFVNSSVHGDFRTSLKYWHMGRIFDQRPVLNGSFVTSDPTDRIFAVTDTDFDKVWVNIHHNCTALRPMPLYSTPSMI